MKPLTPGSTIGILGGGQLGRMLAIAAAQLGFDVCIFTDEPDSPASRVAATNGLCSSGTICGAARPRSRSTSPDISGANSIAAPLSAASTMAVRSVAALVGGSMPLVICSTAIFANLYLPQAIVSGAWA